MAEYKDLLQGKNRGHYVISHYVIKDFETKTVTKKNSVTVLFAIEAGFIF